MRINQFVVLAVFSVLLPVVQSARAEEPTPAPSPDTRKGESADGLVTLRERLNAAQARAAGSFETRAHLAESAARIDECLKASMQRTAF